MRLTTITPRFVDFVPEQLETGVLYVSEKYSTAVHKCCCGCGQEVVTPLSPANWQLRMQGSTVTLTPSIGNWTLKCRSHYFISRNRVEWANPFSERQIRQVRERDRRDRQRYANARAPGHISEGTPPRIVADTTSFLGRIWRALKSLWRN